MYELHVQCILVFPAIHACIKQENAYNIIIIKCKYESFVDQIYVQCFHPFLPMHTLRDRLLANKCGRWRPTSQLLVCICHVVWSYGWWMIVIIWISNLQKKRWHCNSTSRCGFDSEVLYISKMDPNRPMEGNHQSPGELIVWKHDV